VQRALLDRFVEGGDGLAIDLLGVGFVAFFDAFAQFAQLGAEAGRVGAVDCGSFFGLTGALQRRLMICHCLIVPFVSDVVDDDRDYSGGYRMHQYKAVSPGRSKPLPRSPEPRPSGKVRSLPRLWGLLELKFRARKRQMKKLVLVAFVLLLVSSISSARRVHPKPMSRLDIPLSIRSGTTEPADRLPTM
jgi:hypothetical protein